MHRRQLALSEPEQAEVSHHPEGAGSVPSTRIGVQRRRDACLGARGWSGASRRGPVRRPVPLRLSLRHARMWTAHKPSCACTATRQPEPMDGLREARPCLADGCSPTVCGLSDLPDDPGGRRRPRRSRPTCEAPGRVWCRRCQRVARPMPWRTGLGGTRRRTPAPEGSGRSGGGRRAARGGGSGPCRAPCAAETAEERQGAGRW